MRIVPLTPALMTDLQRLLPAGLVIEQLSPDYAALVARPGLGFAALEGGYLLGAGGVVQIWRGRAVAWMIPSIFARPRHFVRALPFAIGLLEQLQGEQRFRRIECHVLAGFKRGHHFALAMGFARETGPLEAWGPSGEAHVQYKRIAPVQDLAEAAE